MEKIDLTPSWVAIMPALIAALQNGSGAGEKLAIEELMDLARKVDRLNEELRSSNKRGIKSINADPEELGIEIAQAYGWDGVEIFKVCIAALTDSNYHKAVRALSTAWDNAEGTT